MVVPNSFAFLIVIVAYTGRASCCPTHTVSVFSVNTMFTTGLRFLSLLIAYNGCTTHSRTNVHFVTMLLQQMRHSRERNYFTFVSGMFISVLFHATVSLFPLPHLSITVNTSSRGPSDDLRALSAKRCF